MDYITTSIFDIFKTGPGPSSSHTIGPMRAACDFLHRSEAAREACPACRIIAELYGSLALTGRGHGTDRAVAAGLAGQRPENCDAETMAQYLTAGGDSFEVEASLPDAATAFTIRFVTEPMDFPYSNTMIFRLIAPDGRELLQETYYSTGGGFLQREGELTPPRPEVPWKYHNFETLRNLCATHRLPAHTLLLENECAISGLGREEVETQLRALLGRMHEAVRRGLDTTGVLPGTIGLGRRAARVLQQAKERLRTNGVRFMEDELLLLNAYSLAGAEENAAGHCVVTAPTSGSAGLLPGVIEFLREHRNVDTPTLLEGFRIAGAVAMLARHNASISGAEVGCQGEIGVASAMAAAMIAHCRGGDLRTVECAAEIALEHHLGLSCDPIGGYVQIPCIERNAVGAVTAWNAAALASAVDPNLQKITFDEVLSAMYDTGQRMNPDFKETSRGGLAKCALCG